MIEAYLEANKDNWAESTAKIVRSALKNVPDPLTTPPDVMFDYLKANVSDYTRKIYWIRIAAYWSWANPSQPNPFKQWAKSHRKAFKNVYQKELLNITFQEAVQRIETLRDPRAKREAKRLLLGAQRWSDRPIGSGEVIGKGSKVRPNYVPQFTPTGISYSDFRRKLGEIGLKPHSLRKLALTRLVEKGATAADLMRVAGWSSINTAVSYLQPKRDNELKEMLGV